MNRARDLESAAIVAAKAMNPRRRAVAALAGCLELADAGVASRADQRLLFMSWQASRVLRPSVRRHDPPSAPDLDVDTAAACTPRSASVSPTTTAGDHRYLQDAVVRTSSRRPLTERMGRERQRRQAQARHLERTQRLRRRRSARPPLVIRAVPVANPRARIGVN
jgi:hypothetical protein